MQDADRADESEPRLFQASDSQGEEGKVAFDKGQVTFNTLFLQQSLCLFDALGLILVKSRNHRLYLVKIVSIKESCLEPSASAGQDWLRRQRQLRVALTVGRTTGRCFYKHHLAGSNEAVDLREGLQCLLGNKADAVEDTGQVNQS